MNSLYILDAGADGRHLSTRAVPMAGGKVATLHRGTGRWKRSTHMAHPCGYGPLTFAYTNTQIHELHYINKTRVTQLLPVHGHNPKSGHISHHTYHIHKHTVLGITREQPSLVENSAEKKTEPCSVAIPPPTKLCVRFTHPPTTEPSPTLRSTARQLRLQAALTKRMAGTNATSSTTAVLCCSLPVPLDSRSNTKPLQYCSG